MSAWWVHAWEADQFMLGHKISSCLHAQLICAWVPNRFMHENPIASRLHAQLISAWVPNWVLHECSINLIRAQESATAMNPKTGARSKLKPHPLKALWTNESGLKSSPLVQMEKKWKPALILHLGIISTTWTWILFQDPESSCVGCWLSPLWVLANPAFLFLYGGLVLCANH